MSDVIELDGLLKQRPVRLYGFEEREDDQIRLVIPARSNGRMGRWLASLFPAQDRKLNLDAFGSFVYRACDGSRTVAEIGAGLKERFGDRVEPLEGRLALFIKEMFKRNLITFTRDE
jgi:hypothetical protein